MLQLRKFVAPEFVFGAGAMDLVARYARNFGGKRILVVTDPGVIGAGWTDKVVHDLSAEDLEAVVFSAVSANPRAEEVRAGAGVYREQGCDVIVAVGGGSPMDCAKGIAIVTANHKDILLFEGIDNVDVPGPPLICIPTTAGTSADVSQFAIISDQQAKVKRAIVSKTTVPDVALIDPMTTLTMDAHLTACSGMDALVHAVEAYVSTASSPLLDLLPLRPSGSLSATWSGSWCIRFRAPGPSSCWKMNRCSWRWPPPCCSSWGLRCCRSPPPGRRWR